MCSTENVFLSSLLSFVKFKVVSEGIGAWLMQVHAHFLVYVKGRITSGLLGLVDYFPWNNLYKIVYILFLSCSVCSNKSNCKYVIMKNLQTFDYCGFLWNKFNVYGFSVLFFPYICNYSRIGIKLKWIRLKCILDINNEPYSLPFLNPVRGIGYSCFIPS